MAIVIDPVAVTATSEATVSQIIVALPAPLAAYVEFLNKFWWVLPIVAAWVLVWKGIALWKAAGNKSKPWFIVLLLVNTLGILEILYIFVFSKCCGKKVVKETAKKVSKKK